MRALIRVHVLFLLSPFGPRNVLHAFWVWFFFAPLMLDAGVSSIGALVGCVDEVSFLVRRFLGEHGLPFLLPSLEDGAHRGDLLTGYRDADLRWVNAHCAEYPVAAQSISGLSREVGGDPAAAACTGARLPDAGEAVVVLERPECHGGLSGITYDSDNVRIEGAVAEGGYGEVLDVIGDDVVVVDEAPAACGGRAEDA